MEHLGYSLLTSQFFYHILIQIVFIAFYYAHCCEKMFKLNLDNGHNFHLLKIGTSSRGVSG